MLWLDSRKAAEEGLQDPVVAARPKHVSTVGQRERCRTIARKRPLADVMNQRMRLAQRLRILNRDLLQDRERLFCALCLKHCFQVPLITLHLGVERLSLAQRK